MNFAREQSLLRQKLQAKASPDIAAVLQQQHGGSVTFLGADHAAVREAAADLAAAWPAMGRAQMTAFVRTLWNSRLHELRAVGVHLLAAREALLEPADLPLLETFLRDDATDAVHAQLASAVVGALVTRNKKLWKDLKRFAASGHAGLARAAVRAAATPLAADAEAFPRFQELVSPLLAAADGVLQAAIDELLVAVAGTHGTS
ncbi:MAG: DNA alkylation repair protein, partial [Planctomycetota bacterium]